MIRKVLIFALVLTLSAVTTAQQPAPAAQQPAPSASPAIPAAQAPALTDLQKLQILNAAKDIELWQLKAQQAASEFEKARATLQQLLAAMTPAGYQINDKLELVKLPEAKKPGT